MRAVLWFLGLFGIAVAAALFAGSNQGTVTLFWPPYRVDFSLNLVAMLAVLGFTILYGALRGLAALFEFPQQARRWRLQQKERMMHAALLDAISQWMAGRFLRARKASLIALAQETALAQLGEAVPHGRVLRAVAHLVAAEASQSLQDRNQRDSHLQQALDNTPPPTHIRNQELREGIQMRAARWALEDHSAHTALQWLADLPQGAARRTLALRIKLKATRQAHYTQEAIETARLLAKHRAFSASAAQSIVRGLAIELIDTAHDPVQLHHIWQSLEAPERQMPELAIHAAQRWMALGGDAHTVRHWLQPVWEQMIHPPSSLGEYDALQLVRTLEQTLEAGLDTVDAVWLAKIEAAHQANPRDIRLQYLAGVACLQRQLWGKAQQLLAQAAPQLHDARLRHRAWCRLAELAEKRQDTQAATLAWKQAALAHQN